MPSTADDSPTFRLYNSLSREVEPVELLEADHLQFYACGPTVYTFAHIGNFRSFLTADLILRTARAIGWDVTYISNVTDVGHLTEDDVADASGEDKMAKALRSDDRSFANIYDLARYYTEALLEDWRALNLREPTVRPRATEHVTDQIDAVQQLVASGRAYETSQGVYFSVESFPQYGQLSGNLEAEELQETDRETVEDPEKRHPRDFALWKKDADHLMQWHSPFGKGFPGWHIECSVMGMRYLGEQFDIHAGGEDLIFPHHECEIAQNESLSGGKSVNYWVHTRFLQVEGEKMSKSKGNFFTVRDLTLPESEGGRGIDPLAVRYALIAGHYRKQLNFTKKALKDSMKAIHRYRAVADLIDAKLENGDDGDDFVGNRLDEIYERTLHAMLDDLNTPKALAAAYEGVKMLQGIGDDLTRQGAESARQWLTNTNDLLGFIKHDTDMSTPEQNEPKEKSELAQKVEELIEARSRAREEKDYEKADAIREELDEMGIIVMDSDEGTTWRKEVEI